MFEREDHVEVFVGIAVIVIFVGNGDLFGVNIAGNLAIAGVTVGIFHVEGWLVGQVDAAGGDQRHFAFV